MAYDINCTIVRSFAPITVRKLRLCVVPAWWAHAHETLLWASKSKGAKHTFNYHLINSSDPRAQVSSVWHIPSVPKREKLYGYHPTQKPLRLVRRALWAPGSLFAFIPCP